MTADGPGPQAPPRRMTFRGATALVAALALGALLAGCGDDSASGISGDTTRFEGHGVSFQYPAAWKPGTDRAEQANRQWVEVFGFDANNIVYMAAYSLSTPVKAGDVQAKQAALDAEIRTNLGKQGATITAGPERTTIGELEGLQYRGTSDSGRRSHRWTFLFADTTEYLVQCNSNGTRKTELEQGCDLATDTFRIGDE